MAINDLHIKLRATRVGYESECRLHRLLIDAYQGTGGFMSTEHQVDTGFMGVVAASYDPVLYQHSLSHEECYLDQFPRESDEKFGRRKKVAHYPNYIAPLTDLKMEFMLKKEFTVDNRPPALSDWREDVDGTGTTWDETLPDLVTAAAVVGYLPVLVDLPEADERVVTQADREALGITPRLVPLFPVNLVDYRVSDSGAFEWAKIRTHHVEQSTPLADATVVTRYTLWFPDRFERYDLAQGSMTPVQMTPDGGQPHAFGEVPIAILRNKAPIGEHVRGLPMHFQESIEARRLFNLVSELDEHMRSSVFALLVLAMSANQEVGDIVGGAENGLPLQSDSGQKHYFLSPDSTVSDAYEKRIEATVEEIYRTARVEFAKPQQSRAAVSGIARKFEFAHTDRAIGAFAKQVARFEEHVDWLVGKGLGLGDEALRAIKVTPPDSFDVEDLQTALQVAIDAVDQLSVGPTATKMITSRVIQQLLPNLTDEQREMIDDELDQAAADADRERQVMDEAALALLQPPDDEELEEEVA